MKIHSLLLISLLFFSQKGISQKEGIKILQGYFLVIGAKPYSEMIKRKEWTHEGFYSNKYFPFTRSIQIYYLPEFRGDTISNLCSYYELFDDSEPIFFTPLVTKEITELDSSMTAKELMNIQIRILHELEGELSVEGGVSLQGFQIFYGELNALKSKIPSELMYHKCDETYSFYNRNPYWIPVGKGRINLQITEYLRLN